MQVSRDLAVMQMWVAGVRWGEDCAPLMGSQGMPLLWDRDGQTPLPADAVTCAHVSESCEGLVSRHPCTLASPAVKPTTCLVVGLTEMFRGGNAQTESQEETELMVDDVPHPPRPEPSLQPKRGPSLVS